ncbi:MAG: two-component sensor histidine kinase, partial [Craterilacuibacter sp.]
MRYPVIATTLVAIILLYLLAIATGNTSPLSNYYWLVFTLNSLLLLGLIGVVTRQVIRLRRRVKTRVFGAKLMQKMVVMFTIAALVPGMLVFTVSAQFLTRSIESWFNVRVENALDRGLDLGRNALGYVLSDLSRKARIISNEIAELPADTLSLRLSRLREQMDVQEVTVLGRNGQIISFAGPDSASYLPELPGTAQMRALKLRQPLQSIETSRDGTLMLKVLLSYRSYSDGETRVLQMLQPAPA